MKPTRLLPALLSCLLASGARAYINPDYTPVEMFRDAETVLLLHNLEMYEQDGIPMLHTEVAREIKGLGMGVRAFSTGNLEEFARQEFADLVKRHGQHGAMLVSGDFSGGDVDSSEDEPAFFLHLGNQWFALEMREDGRNLIGEPSAAMLAVWNGATHMLVRCAAYVLNNPNAVVPAEGGTEWGEPETLGELQGEIHAILTVDSGQDQAAAWIHAAEGDQWLHNGTLTPLGFSSRLGVAGPFGPTPDEGEGDGTALIAHTGTAFKKVNFVVGDTPLSQPQTLDLSFDDTPVGLHAMIRDGKPALLVAGQRSVKWFGDGLTTANQLSHELEADTPGAIGSALADFTGNGHADLAWVFPEQLLLFEGNPEGGFLPARVAATFDGMGADPVRVRVGDLDGDGRLDLVLAGGPGTRLLLNHGEGFEDLFPVSGETSYIAGPGVRDILFADFTHDNRMDLVFVYDNRGALFFFNRGFSSFGFAIDMDIGDTWEGSLAGSVAAATGNFRGEGTPDILFLTTTGELVLLPGGERE